MRRTVGLTILLTAAYCVSAHAQYFGQNRVNYRSFDFNVIETEHFDVYYYDDVRDAAVNAARMAERSYARLSRLLNHQYRERQPIILYASHADFQQNNLTDIGEGIQGVTDPYRHRVMLPFTGSYEEFEHVLQHEIVHQFQFDIFARGHIGAGIERLIAVQPPLWLTEGMAEYLSVGPDHSATNMWVRDAVAEGTLPTIEQLTTDGRIFPYRFGHALMAFIGERWGDDVIADIFHGVASGGLESGFRRALGMDLMTLSQSWHQSVRTTHIPDTSLKQRVEDFSRPAINRERSDGGLHVSPALSPDGEELAYFSEANSYSVNLYLADATTGRVEDKLVSSAFSANFESLRFLNSSAAWSPDGKYLAFPAQRSGRDDIVILDVKRRKEIRRFRPPVAGVTNPAWSPDGKRIVFTGLTGGVSDLFVINSDGSGLERLTDDNHADLHPAWSPNGNRIAFVTDRSSDTEFAELRPRGLTVAILDLDTRVVELLPSGSGRAINPQWSPNGDALAFVSDQTGVANVFLYDLVTRSLSQLTDVYTGVAGITPTSPAISWAKGANRLALTYYEHGEYNIYTVSNPEQLARPLVPTPVAELTENTTPSRVDPQDSGIDALIGDGGTSTRTYSSVPRVRPRGFGRGRISVKALLDSAMLVLPDSEGFQHSRYSPRLMVDYFAQPQVGYVRDNFGSGVYGGAAVALSDMMGNRRLLLGGQVNGHLAESQFTAVYANMAKRTNWAIGFQQTPYFFFSGADLGTDSSGQRILNQRLQRFVVRRAFVEAYRPFSRFSRLEYRLSAINMGVGELNVQTTLDRTGSYVLDQDVNRVTFGSESYLQPAMAWVFDNTLMHMMGPFRGRRSRLEYAPAVGTWQFHQLLMDTRRYDGLPGSLTLATRLMFFGRFGHDSNSFPIFIGVPDLLRGYTSGSFRRRECSAESGAVQPSCKELNQLIGSRVAVFNAELRLPLWRPDNILPFRLPPLEAAIFFDSGIAWSDGSELTVSRKSEADKQSYREPLSSWGVSLRSNVFGILIMRADFTKPLSRSGHSPYWTLSLGPTF